MVFAISEREALWQPFQTASRTPRKRSTQCPNLGMERLLILSRFASISFHSPGSSCSAVADSGDMWRERSDMLSRVWVKRVEREGEREGMDTEGELRRPFHESSPRSTSIRGAITRARHSHPLPRDTVVLLLLYCRCQPCEASSPSGARER